jgi:hypothetical protein
MQSWGTFATTQPDLAQFGVARLHGQVAYLGTVNQWGWPRVHPVTPIIGHNHLFLFMEPTSPKSTNLRRGSGYCLHASVVDTTGSNGEFQVSGIGRLIEGPAIRRLAIACAPLTYIAAHDIL